MCIRDRITTEGDACGLTFAARVSRDEDEFYSHAELQGVERSATEILRYYILAEWYLSIRANDLWTAYTQKLTAAVATLSSYPVSYTHLAVEGNSLHICQSVEYSRRFSLYQFNPSSVAPAWNRASSSRVMECTNSVFCR